MRHLISRYQKKNKPANTSKLLTFDSSTILAIAKPCFTSTDAALFQLSFTKIAGAI